MHSGFIVLLNFDIKINVERFVEDILSILTSRLFKVNGNFPSFSL
jgi:hypothetical protein